MRPTVIAPCPCDERKRPIGGGAPRTPGPTSSVWAADWTAWSAMSVPRTAGAIP